MIPHHLAYPKGHRGVNWEVFREDCTPVVEIFSEHGNSEDDRGPFAFYTHSMGGRETPIPRARRWMPASASASSPRPTTTPAFPAPMARG